MKSDLREIRLEAAVTDRCDRIRAGSGGQLGAALGTATVHNCAAGASTHAQTEAVHAGTTTVVRLESTLPLSHWVLLESILQVVLCPAVGTGLISRRDDLHTRLGDLSTVLDHCAAIKPAATCSDSQSTNYIHEICSQPSPQMWITVWTTRAGEAFRGNLLGRKVVDRL